MTHNVVTSYSCSLSSPFSACTSVTSFGLIIFFYGFKDNLLVRKIINTSLLQHLLTLYKNTCSPTKAASLKQSFTPVAYYT